MSRFKLVRHLLASSGGGGSSVIAYDTSIGNGVDSNGFTDLPLRSGARYIYVKPTGSDAADGLTHATAVQTPTHALTLVTSGHGNQILLAEGGAYGTLPVITEKSGFSLLYPTVIQSYDPADDTNTAKFGRATANRPSFNAYFGAPILYSPGTVAQQNYIVIRGINLDAGNTADIALSFNDLGDGILIENCIYAYTSIAFTKFGSISAKHWIFRNNAIYGGFSEIADQSGGGIYADGCESMTVEDNVLYHNGWKIGGSRSDDWTIGGPTEFRHPLYLQSTTNSVTRRNLIIDGSTLSVIRGHSTVRENLCIDNPGGFSIGDDNLVSYSSDHPYGSDLEAAYNAIFGDADINSVSPLGWGITTTDGRNGSSTHHNLIVQSRSGTSNAAPTFRTRAYYPIPSYMDWHDNVSYNFSAPGSVAQAIEDSPDGSNGSGGVGQTHPTYTNNKWDATASGSNVQSTAGMFATIYTASTLYTALGYADKAAFIAYAIAHPEAHIQRTARALLFTGYSMPATALAILNALTLSSSSFSIGTAKTVPIMGGTGGSVITASGLPSGLTLNNADHTLIWSGSGSASSPSISLTETDPDGQTRTSTISCTIA